MSGTEQKRPVALIVRASAVSEVVKRWNVQHPNTAEADKREIGERLAALPSTARPAEIDAIIGNDTWTHTRCIGCGDWFTEAIQIGEEPDYESSTVTLCATCADELVALIHDWRTSQRLAMGDCNND